MMYPLNVHYGPPRRLKCHETNHGRLLPSTDKLLKAAKLRAEPGPRGELTSLCRLPANYRSR